MQAAFIRRLLHCRLPTLLNTLLDCILQLVTTEFGAAPESRSDAADFAVHLASSFSCPNFMDPPFRAICLFSGE
jgi:hypothetical protein